MSWPALRKRRVVLMGGAHFVVASKEKSPRAAHALRRSGGGKPASANWEGEKVYSENQNNKQIIPKSSVPTMVSMPLQIVEGDHQAEYRMHEWHTDKDSRCTPVVLGGGGHLLTTL